MRYRLKIKNYPFDKVGMILEGKVTEGVLRVYAGDMVKRNKNMMSKEDIMDCLACGITYKLYFPLEILEEIKSYKVTRLELEMLKHINERGIEYIARDRNNSLCAYKSRPYKIGCMWTSTHTHYTLSLFEDYFLFIKWEDEEPALIKNILENCEVVEDGSTRNV